MLLNIYFDSPTKFKAQPQIEANMSTCSYRNHLIHPAVQILTGKHWENDVSFSMAYIIIRAGTLHRFEQFVHQRIMAKMLMTWPMNEIHLRDTADVWEHPEISSIRAFERLGSELTFSFSEQQQHYVHCACLFWAFMCYFHIRGEAHRLHLFWRCYITWGTKYWISKNGIY